MIGATLQHLQGPLWMIDPRALERVVQALGIVDVSGFDPSAAHGSGDGDLYEVDGDVATIRIGGVMMRRVPPIYQWIGKVFGLEFTDMEATREALARAVEDSRVESVTLSIDSPGGTALGIESLAQDVGAANALKPITTIVDGYMASAALYAGVQAGTVAAHVGDMIGSIGTFCVVHDSSKLYEDAGVKVHVISNHPGKGWADGAPISEEQLSDLQSMVDGYASQFVDAVARGRGMTTDAARKLATGAMWHAEEAMALGLIDSVATSRQSSDTRQTTNPAAKATNTPEPTMPTDLEKAIAATATEKARADSLKISLDIVQDARRDELVAKYQDRVTAENKPAVLEFAAFCAGDFGKFEGHLKSLPVLTRSIEQGADAQDADRPLVAEPTKGERQISKLFGMSHTKIEKLGQRGTTIGTGGTLEIPDASCEDGIREIRKDEVAAYLAVTKVSA